MEGTALGSEESRPKGSRFFHDMKKEVDVWFLCSSPSLSKKILSNAVKTLFN
jgi:hypothetical protein